MTAWQWPPEIVTRKRTKTTQIIIHHAASSTDISAEEIHRQHLRRGWIGIGYHGVIRFNGTVETGRPLDAIGAHVSGFNQESIGICLSGNFDYHPPSHLQMEGLAKYAFYLTELYPDAVITLHKHHSATACPGRLFSWAGFWKAYGKVKEKAEELKNMENFDVSPWAREARNWAMQTGISDGTRPKEAVTREEFWVMIFRYHNRERSNG